jgi:hypothetical protein
MKVKLLKEPLKLFHLVTNCNAQRPKYFRKLSINKFHGNP